MQASAPLLSAVVTASQTVGETRSSPTTAAQRSASWLLPGCAVCAQLPRPTVFRPAEQSERQVAWPSCGWYSPTPHATQSSAPSLPCASTTVPGWQPLQLVWPSSSW